jgi:ferrochelatase
MRYGNPSLESGLDDLIKQGATHIHTFLMYPQHADSTRTTSIKAIERLLPDHVRATFTDPFYNNAAYIDCLAQSMRPALPAQFDHLLLSYHGLPEAHLLRADPTGAHCLKTSTCCETASSAHQTCYRHQSRVTTDLLTRKLGLDPQTCSMSYQSRLGRQKWLEPYTDQILTELPSRGVKHLAVACPAFVADNLETLEEIGIQGRELFCDAGGETLTLIPCLNDAQAWVDLAASWCIEASDAARQVGN